MWLKQVWNCVVFQESSDAELAETPQPSTEASSSVAANAPFLSQEDPSVGTGTGTGGGEKRPVFNVEMEQDGGEESVVETDGEKERVEEGEGQQVKSDAEADRLRVPQLNDLQVGDSGPHGGAS